MKINLPGTTLNFDLRYQWVLRAYFIFASLIDFCLLLKFVVHCFFSCLLHPFKSNPRPKSLKGQLALVTGTGNGLGRPLAVRLAQLGMRVVCVDIHDEGNQATVDLLAKEGVECHALHCDISDHKQVHETANYIKQKIGIPNLIINNAALTTRKSLMKHTKPEISTMFKTNVIGPMFLVMEFLPDMFSDPLQRHHIVGISSIVGLLGRPDMVPYSATKFAMTGFMEGLKHELSRDKIKNIVTTIVHPFLISSQPIPATTARYQGLIGIESIDSAVDQILEGILTEANEVFIPKKLYYMTSLLKLIPRDVQTKILEFVEFGAEV